jgi:hypothetical protein
MTQQDYDQKKRECWEEFSRNIPAYDLSYCYRIFGIVFDRAFAFGKKIGNSDFSDAEEEGMLTVSRKRVREMYAANERIKADSPDKETAHISDHINHVLKHLFGSKCLPDNVESSEPNVDSSEPNVDSSPQNPTENCDNKSHISADCNKPAEPKFKVGDKVRYRPSGNVYEVEGKTGRQHYALKGWLKYVLESDLEPYTRSNPNPSNSGDLKLQTVEDKSEVNYVNLSQNIKNCDNRLQIAAMAMQGILSNIDLFKNVLETGTEILSGDGIPYRAVANASLLFADALIAESEIIKQPLTKH